MPDFLHTCIAAMVAARPSRTRLAGLGCGRDAVARLGIALALIVVLFGAVNWEASGMEHGVRVAQVEMAAK